MTTDSKIKLATCNRCGRYVFSSLVGGFKTMADPTPLDGPESVREAICDSRAVLWVESVSGRPWKLHGARPADITSGRTLVAEHGCGTRGMNASKVEAVPVGPHRAPAPPGVTPGGIPAPVARAGATRSPAGSVTRRPFRRHIYRRCEACGEIIGSGIDYVGLQIGDKWIWLRHDWKCT